MASVCNSTTTLKTPFIPSTSSLASTPKPSQLFLHGKRNQNFKVSCKVSNNDQNQNVETNSVDRRNVLLGLGGLYGAANVVPLGASAAPTPPPDLKSCGRATISDGPPVPYSCCPPPMPDNPDTIPYYKFPSMTKLRIRSPAHAADEEYIAKYSLAIQRMRDLDRTEPSNPLGFKQQANIHCAYCNGAYIIGGKELQVHNSWLFFPFHRWYLYFYERMLGTLIDDPTFALPYWNWDHPKGMRLPPMFDRRGTSLYDERRNQQAIGNGNIVDLGSFGDQVQTTQLQVMTNNLTLMYRQMVTNAPCPLLFFGAPYVLGNNVEAPGTIETIPHIPVHIWVGTVRGSTLPGGGTSYGEDMGNFYSAGLDPVFYCHHANVDRMWNEWKAIGGKRTDIQQKDWLNSEFFFYDENKNPYRVKVRDCLDPKRMGYDFAPMPTPWRNFKPKTKITSGKVNTGSIPPASQVFPLAKMDKVIFFSIDRPAPSRTQQQKNEQEEMLTFNNIKYDNREYIRFDVYLNVDKNVNPNELDKAEFAGSYTSLPHVHGANASDHTATATLQLAITEILEDIGLEDEKKIAVALVPRKGGEITSIESVEIGLVSC